MKVVILGAKGQLGKDIVEVLKNEFDVVPLDMEDINIGIPEDLNKLKDIKPDVIINTAAYHNVPDCEINKDLAFRINGYALKDLSLISNEIKSYLIHISTDYVFDGMKGKPYTEEDIPNPLNTYAISKYVGEIYVRNYAKDWAIVRVSGLYGINPCVMKKGMNFVDLIISKYKNNEELSIVDDQFLTPTYTYYIAKQLHLIIKRKINGIIHSTCEGETNWFDFANAVFEILNVKVKINRRKTSPDEFVKRPFYSVLENSVLKKEGINIMPHWKDALKEYLSLKYPNGV